MGIIDFLLLLLIAGICGSIAQGIAGFSRGGCITSIAVGFIGALIGPWIAKKMALPELFTLHIGTTNFPVIWAIIGAALFSAILSLISPRKHD
jgi:uncharacterized membrane protein YeaQ/YmgE (transglycosylase-associated protein family)